MFLSAPIYDSWAKIPLSPVKPYGNSKIGCTDLQFYSLGHSLQIGKHTTHVFTPRYIEKQVL